MNYTKSCTTKQRSGALHITQKVDYGIILLTALTKTKNDISIKKIAENYNLSFLFLQKVAGLLQKSNLIKATRGKYGGYKLIKNPKKIAVKEIIEAIEGNIAIVPCLVRKTAFMCKHKPYCIVRKGFRKINDEIQNQLLNKKLSYFI
jgi:Rrf2 family protein